MKTSKLKKNSDEKPASTFGEKPKATPSSGKAFAKSIREILPRDRFKKKIEATKTQQR